jgi:hypothetical protein
MCFDFLYNFSETFLIPRRILGRYHKHA